MPYDDKKNQICEKEESSMSTIAAKEAELAAGNEKEKKSGFLEPGKR